MTMQPDLFAQRRDRVLAEARAALFSSVDCEGNLEQVARLAVPTVADGCVIHMLDRDGTMRLLTALHSDVDRTSTLQSLHRREASAGLSEDGPWNVLRRGEPELLLDAGTHYLARARDLREREMLERLELGSSASAPMLFQQRLVGAIILLTTRYGRRLTERDLALVENLAHYAAGVAAHSQLLRERERLNRVNDQFLSAYTHNLRNSVGSVHVWLELLRAERLGNSGARAVSMLDRSLRHLANLVNQLADVSQLLTGRLRLEKQMIDPPGLFDGVLQALAPEAEAKGLRLSTEVDRSIEWLWGDPQRLGQALEHLVANAIHFTPRGGSVFVRLQRRENQARIEVRDTGIGISTDALPSILESFREGGGFGDGLGLAVARQIVELHEGRIGAESEGEGRGSVFTLDLPIDPPADSGLRWPWYSRSP